MFWQPVDLSRFVPVVLALASLNGIGELPSFASKAIQFVVLFDMTVLPREFASNHLLADYQIIE
ncbi:MAG: hypothetical protein ACPGVU_13460 [Limisphaerales bacterium]